VKFTREFKVGLIFLAAIALFIWGFNFLKGTNLFSKTRYFYAVYNKVDGLEKSNKVLVNGLRIGQVQDMDFIEGSSKIIVEMYIKSDIEIPANSVAKIFATDLLGSKAVEIVMGDSPIYAGDGDTLISSLESSLKDQLTDEVEPLKRKAIVLINSIDSVMAVIQSIFNENTRQNLASTIENIRNTLRNAESVSANIDTILNNEKSRVGAILSNLESISRNLDGNNEKINNIITNFETLSDSLASSDLSKTVREAGVAINNLKEISDKINRGEGTIGQLFTNDTLYYNLEKSTSSLDKLLEDIRLNPKRYVKLSLF
jgi:phospholipid/cholesterol/gamma-HCH transport system substrate-binding protein